MDAGASNVSVESERAESAARDEEREWIARCLRGETRAFRFLVERHERMVRSLIRRLIAQDHEVDELAQQTFVSAFEHLGRYAGEARFSTWLGQIALNKSRDWMRARRRRQVDIDDDADGAELDVGDPGLGPEEQTASRRRDVQIQAALAQLRPAEREVIVLKHIQGHDYETVARLLGCKVEAAKVRALRAREALKRILQQMGIEP